MIGHSWPRVIPLALFATLLVIAVACGSAATPTPKPTNTVSPAGALPAATRAATTVPTATAAPAATTAPVAAPTSAAAPSPGVRAEPGKKHGGILRWAFSNVDPAHFDLVQSATAVNFFPQGPMYSGLVRYNPLDGGKSIIPDLAHSWKVSEDGLRYTFFLREGVKFHDGALLTADDVVATFSRIIRPPEGIISVRQNLFKAIKEVNAPDPLTVEFVFSRPSAIVFPALAQDWNRVIVRKKTLEDNKYDLRRVKDYPGTGAFRFGSYLPGEKWTLERYRDYWNQGLPYLDGVQIIHAPAPKGVALIISGQVDHARGVGQEGLRLAQERKLQWQVYATANRQGVLMMNLERAPFNDLRVRKAIDLVVDRQALIEVAKVVVDWKISRWAIPGTEYSLPEPELLKLPGLRPDKTEDIKEAKRLMAEAGYPKGFGPVDFLVRDTPSIAVPSPALQEMLKRQLGIDSKIRLQQSGVWLTAMERGDFDIANGVPGVSSFDPAEYLAQYYSTGAGLNYFRYSNKQFDEILERMDQELDSKKRGDLVRQALGILEQDIPVVEIGWNTNTDIWYPYVKDVPDPSGIGHFEFWRWDTVWLDK